MSKISFADVVHQSISFDTSDPAEALIIELIDNPWVQRLRDVSQTANTRLVYMFSEHSRFGHSLGAAYLACKLVNHLSQSFKEVHKYKKAIVAAALLHDIGHLAPGSHLAQKCWFPDLPDSHEEISIRILTEDNSLKNTLAKFDKELPKQVSDILSEADSIPPWTWEIISGSSWNVDRGNWCIVDSAMSGVSYGHYNIPALMDSITISSDGHMALKENRLDALMHFAVSRHAMYRQIYQHRVILAADCLLKAIVQRARDLEDRLEFADSIMKKVLTASDSSQLTLDEIFIMREAWWRYHLAYWQNSKDAILSDLAKRLFNRNLFKTIRVKNNEELNSFQQTCHNAVTQLGFDPKYYLFSISTKDINSAESSSSMKVILDDGTTQNINTADPLMSALVNGDHVAKKQWVVLPAEVKALLGRSR